MVKDINGVELQEGMFVKITGCKVKNDNSVYIIEVDQNTNKEYTTRDSYILHKVNANGTESKANYNILFVDKWLFEKNPEVKIEVITDLKQAAKDVKNFLNGITASEKVYSFTNVEINKAEDLQTGMYLRFTKLIVWRGCQNAQKGTYAVKEINTERKSIHLHLIGSKGEEISMNVNNQYQGNSIIITLTYETTNKLLAEDKIVIQERTEITKGELNMKETKQNEIKVEVITEETEQQTEQVIETVVNETTQDQAQQETTKTIERKYFPINEQLAKTSQTLWSFYDYVPNRATEGYKTEVEKAYKIVDKIAKEKPDRLHDALTIAERYSKAYAEWENKGYSIEMMCPSVMICGGSNFPVRKKEKQNNARDKHMKDFEYVKGYFQKLENILHSNEVIKSGDVDAVEKLTEKLKQLEESQELMKNVNAYYRKNKTLEGCTLISQKVINAINDLMIRIPYHTQPFASYELTNNNASIKATKQRLEALQKVKEEGTKETIQSDICKVVENSEIMRMQLIFDGKPDAETRSILKSNGFIWAPSQGAWQRQLTDNARYSTKKVIEQLEKLTA